MYNKPGGIPEKNYITDYQENLVLYGMPEAEWIEDYQENESIWWSDDLDDDDNNTGGIAPTPRPKQPKPSPKTNDSETFPD